MKNFRQILEAKKITTMINGPEKPVMKLIKKHNGKVVDVTDKGSAIVDISADELRGLKRSMSGLESKDYDLAVPNPDGGFDTAMI